MSSDPDMPPPKRRGPGAKMVVANSAAPFESSASRSGSAALDGEDKQLLRGMDGRLLKGTRSLNPGGAPRKPALGRYTKRLQKTRLWTIDGKVIEESDREMLDRVVHRAAIERKRGAPKLFDERNARAIDREKEHRLYRLHQERKTRERELGISKADIESSEAKLKANTAVFDAIRAMLGNFGDLKDELESMGAIAIDDGQMTVAAWAKRPGNT
jgi:hypothetical protein